MAQNSQQLQKSKIFFLKNCLFFNEIFVPSYETIKAMTWQIYLIHQILVSMETA